MKKVVTVIGFMLIMQTRLFSQEAEGEVLHNVLPNYELPSSNNITLIRRVETPVDHVNGSPILDLPIITLSKNGYDIPVHIKYSSNGMKVNDVPSEVGMGWGLVAGGGITRVIKNQRDERSDWPYGYLHSGGVGGEHMDKLPDIFYYETPSESGKFQYNAEGIPITLPLKPIKIVTPFGPKAPPTSNPDLGTQWGNYFKVIDTQGFVHVFKDKELRQCVFDETYKTTKVSKTNGNANVYREIVEGNHAYDEVNRSSYEDKKRDTNEYESAWRLSEIYDLNQELIAEFEYYNVNNIEESTYSQTQDKWWDYFATKKIDRSSLKVIKSITIPNGLKVEFKYFFNSKYPLGHLLNRIDIKDESGNIDMIYNFSYDEIALNYLEEDRRVFLKEIRKNQQSLASFDYYDLANFPQKHTKNSPYIDAWGYFLDSDQDVNSLLPYVDRTFGCPELDRPLYRGGTLDRLTPNLNSTRVGAVKSYTNEYGGTKEFVYELNSLSDNTTKFGGLRLSKVVLKDIDQQVFQVKNYSYRYSEETRPLAGYPIPILESTHDMILSRLSYPNPKCNDWDIITYDDKDWYRFRASYITSFPQEDFYYSAINNVIYNEVTESIAGKGKIVYDFFSYNEVDFIPTSIEYNPSTGNTSFFKNQLISYSTPFTIPNYLLGNIESMKYYDGSNSLVKEINNTYRQVEGTPSDNSYIGKKLRKESVISPNWPGSIDINTEITFTFNPSFYQLTNTETIEYNGHDGYISNRESYYYNYLGQLRRKIKGIGTSDQFVTTYKYPSDYNPNFLMAVYENHIQDADALADYAECISCQSVLDWNTNYDFYFDQEPQGCEYYTHKFVSFKDDKCLEVLEYNLSNQFQDIRILTEYLDDETLAIWMLNHRNAISQPVQITTRDDHWNILNSQFLSSTITIDSEYFVDSDRWGSTYGFPFKVFPHESYKSTTFNSQNTDLVKIEEQAQGEFSLEKSDNFFPVANVAFEKDTDLETYKVSQFKTRDGSKSIYRYGLDGKLRIEVSGTEDLLSDYIIEDFERASTEFQTHSSGISINNNINSFAGENIAVGNGSISLTQLNANTESYHFSIAYSEEDPTYSIKVNGASLDLRKSIEAHAGWKILNYSIDVSSMNSIQIQFEGVQIDNFILVPAELDVSIIHQDPIFGVLSKTFKNGTTQYFEYDDLGRLTAIRNHRNELVEEVAHNYNGDN